MNLLSEKIGFYTVDGKAYPNKISAILAAQPTLSKVSWNFYDDFYSNYDWATEPSDSIDELYRKRALQLRESYDYIVIRCSGGADSTNVLYSFLNNGIMPNEVVGEAPLSGLSNWKWNNKDTRMINTVSEFKYAQIPTLDYVSKNFPLVKVTQIDNFNRMINPSPDSWLLNCNDGIDAHASFEGTMWESKHLHLLASAGKTIAIVTGTDKPYVYITESGEVMTCFVDLPLNYLKQPLIENFPNVHRVPFYWTPDYPEVAAKMSHIIAKKLFGKNIDNRLFAAMLAKIPAQITTEKQPKNEILNFLISIPTTDYVPGNNIHYNPNNVYGRGVCPYIYPTTYNPSIFQAEKQNANQTFFGVQQDWFRILHGNSRGMEMMTSDFANIYKSIHPSYLNYYQTGFSYYEKSYSLGPASNFKNK